MEAKKVSVERGWGWIADGWSLFMKNPGMWVLIILIFSAIMYVLSFIVLLGPLVCGLLGTMLAGGIIYAASRLDGGGSLVIAQLFQAFMDPTRTGPMLILGLISLLASLLMGIISEGLMAGSVIGTGLMGGINAMNLGISVLFGILLIMLMTTALAAVLIYAIPLVMLERMAPYDAIKSSVMGCLHNWLPLIVFDLICSVLVFLSAITMGLGFLIIGPVIAGAWYQSYKDIYVG